MSGVAAATMRAVRLTGPRRPETVEVTLPEAGPGEVRVRLEGCGVCASNLVPWEGAPWMRYPTDPGGLGHEGWGVVDALGAGVDGLVPGQRVATLGEGAYAEHQVVPAGHVVPLPSALDGRPFPGEPLGCALNILRRSGIAAGHTVAVVGVGFLGALLTRLAVDAGARVIALSRRPFSLEVAEAMGAHVRLLVDDPARAVEQVRALTRGQLCDRVIEAVGKEGPLDLAAELTRERGRLVVAGYHQDGPRQVNLQLWNWRGLDVVNAHERNPAVYLEGMRAAVDAVASGRLDPDPLYTHVFPLDALDQALDAARERPDGFLKALVVT